MGSQRDKNPHICFICWHATKAISKFNLCGSILAVRHINDDCWLALFERSNFITTIPNQFFTPDTNTTSRHHTLAHDSHALPVLCCSGKIHAQRGNSLVLKTAWGLSTVWFTLWCENKCFQWKIIMCYWKSFLQMHICRNWAITWTHLLASARSFEWSSHGAFYEGSGGDQKILSSCCFTSNIIALFT